MTNTKSEILFGDFKSRMVSVQNILKKRSMVAVANKNLQSKFKLRAFKLTQFINYYSFVCGAQQA
jgi:hypothetical protein